MTQPKDVEINNGLNLFKEAYQNRYTWDSDFPGYKGKCIWKKNGELIQGEFSVGPNLKAKVKGVNEENTKIISSQLWEVAIHRVRRSFEEVHGQNTFHIGDTNEVGTEVIVGGKNKGDKYRVKNNIVTMVYRHIHGSLIKIITNKILDTGSGYLSQSYTSQYLDPNTINPIRGQSTYFDQFTPLSKKGPWVLSNRLITVESFKGIEGTRDEFIFTNLSKYDANP